MRTVLRIARCCKSTTKQSKHSVRSAISTSDGEVELEIEEAKEPGVDDQLVERDGVKVYLDPVAASALDDQVLGIHGHDDHFHFSFDEQEGTA
jgi:Fe-S cluster assembly iron-binding protein IscA